MNGIPIPVGLRRALERSAEDPWQVGGPGGKIVRSRVRLWRCCALFSTLCWLGCGGPSATRPADAGTEISSVAVDVRVAAPVRKTIQRRVELQASFKAFESTTLYSKVSGFLRRIEVDLGDRVARDQLIAEIEVPELVEQLEETEAGLAVAKANHVAAAAELEGARANLEFKEVSYRRTRAVRDEDPDVISRQRVDEAMAQFRLAEASVKVIESRMEQIRSEIKRVEATMRRLRTLIGFSEIRAPFNGIVTERFVDTGALLQAATSSTAAQRIVDVASIDKLRLFVDVPEAEAPFVEVGDPAVVEVDSLPGREFEAQVTRFAGVLNPSTRAMRTEMHIANPGWVLRPGMYGRATLSLHTRTDVITIPAEALRVDGESTFVYCVAGGAAKRFDVKTADRDGISVEVTAGLDGTERVVISARGPVADGSPVRSVESLAELGL